MKLLRMPLPEVEKPELDLPTTRSYSYGQDLCPTGTRPCPQLYELVVGKTHFRFFLFLEKIHLMNSRY